MSLTLTPPKKRWKWALSIGGILGFVSGLAGISPDYISFSEHETLARFVHFLHLLELPGLFLQALILREGHGGGRPLETLFLIILLNIVLYALLCYGIIACTAKFPPKIAIAMGGILAIILVSILIPPIRKLSHYRNVYGSLKQGATKTEVLQEWGPPSFSSVCRYTVKWDGNPIPAGTKSCIEEIWYSSPITSDEWGIGFDADGHAISKYHLTSP